ncbi:uncharacterized protein LOC135936841 isoform X2 [Cloeon dipterum]|uniref:uncharacterized protein LOC135936841 isoform X2 n=1 Tax=Cloeon dipterum TaxID=197152 RepID=UPI00321F83E2
MMVLVGVIAGLLGAAWGGHVQQEVAEGSSVTLPCLSTADGEHQFQFWMLDDDSIVGPDNPGDRKKYTYEVLSGNLSIRAVNVDDSGHYRCVAKGWKSPIFNIEQVELVVHKDWEEVWADDTGVNILRGVLALTALCVCGGVACVLLRMRRHNYLKSEDLSDEEDELQQNEGNSSPQRRASIVEINVLETDLPRTLNSMYRSN